MIGYYNYTVILTFMSLFSAVTGMTLAHSGNLGGAILCIALSGFFDIFDGRVARTKKDRTQDERLFGIELDSLCDAVAFVAAPAFFCYSSGVDGNVGFLGIIFYAAAGIMRLGYYNVQEINLFFSGKGHTEVYHGLPVTTAAVAFPAAFMFKRILPGDYFPALLTIILFVVGTLFISPITLKTLKLRTLIILSAVVAVILIITFIISGGNFADAV